MSDGLTEVLDPFTLLLRRAILCRTLADCADLTSSSISEWGSMVFEVSKPALGGGAKKPGKKGELRRPCYASASRPWAHARSELPSFHHGHTRGLNSKSRTFRSWPNQPFCCHRHAEPFLL